MKEQLGLERNMHVKGIDSIETYSNLFWIAEKAATMTRVQNGVREKLLGANGRIMS